jgi:CPA1 family monovalent cation:H+ antiporter
MSTLQLISTLVAIAAVFGWLAVRVLRLPLTIGTVLLTVASALTLEAIAGYAPGLHAAALGLVQQIDFEALILHGMLSLLLFAGAFLLDLGELYRERFVVTVLSTLGTLISAAAMTLLMHLVLVLLGQPANWYACMFFGALISPTDPIAVLEMLRRVGAPAHLQAQLAGESLFNDGVGAVLFLTVLAASRGAAPTVHDILGLLVLEVGGALALGVLLAWVTSHLMRSVASYQVEILLTLSTALGGYALADRLGFSAPLEAVTAGIALRWLNSRLPRRTLNVDSIDRFWEVIDEVQNSVLFVLLGLEVLAISFRREYFYTGLAAIVTTILVRVAMLVATLSLVVGIRRVMHWRHRHRVVPGTPQLGHGSSLMVLAWGGLRGGLSLALALAVPRLAADRWVLPTTYFVVVFSIVVQGWSIDRFLRRFQTPAADVVV